MSDTRNTSSMNHQGHGNLRHPQSYNNKTLMTKTESLLDYFLLAGALPPRGHVIFNALVFLVQSALHQHCT
ncbi:hypothetical protein NEAUS03_1516 [Nematocida ausubeli]|nr:hypothetical protein NEAUS03_1516 [Nematocida ausubeli]